MNPILVTPGTIGDHVASQLISRGLRVRVLVRKALSDSPWAAMGVEQVAGDFADLQSLAAAFRGVEKFFSVSPPGESLAQFGINSIEAAIRAGVKYIVRSSGMGADVDAAGAIPRLHTQVEHALAASGIPHTVLRPNAFMQNYLGQADGIKAQGAFYLPQGDARMSVVDTRDVAAVAVLALTGPGHEGKTYTLTGPAAVSNPEVAEEMSAQLGRSIRYIDVTDDQAAGFMRSAGMTEWLVRAMIEFMQAARAGYLADVTQDAERVLGRKPNSFSKFLKDHLSAFGSRDQGAASVHG